jgi:glycosyltransferase involved in cell wall biosynthesis
VETLGRRPGVDFGLVRRLARSLRRGRVELVHAHQYTPWFYASLGAALGWRRPRILFTEHGRHYPDVPRGKRMAFNQGLLPITDGIVAVSGFVRDCLAANEALPRRRIRVVYNGVDSGRFESPGSRAGARASQGIDPGDPVVGIAARFAPVKDHATLLRAFARVLGEIPRAKLALAGDGELRASLETQAQGLGIAGSCRFLGVRRDIPDLLSSWDLFCLSSLSEGTSVTLLEAMAAGLPVVATRVGGNPEIVVDGTTGLLASRGDDAGLARAIVEILEDPTRARGMGEAGRARVRASFTQERMTEDYRTLYGELLAGGRT